MSSTTIVLLASIIVIGAWLTARKASRDGLPFWRSFIMAVLGYTGVSLLFLKLIS